MVVELETRGEPLTRLEHHTPILQKQAQDHPSDFATLIAAIVSDESVRCASLMSASIIGDENFELRSFSTFPLLEHVLGVGRMFCAPRFELVSDHFEPLDEDDAFLADLGEAAPPLFLPITEGLVSLPSSADLDLVLGRLVATLRDADAAVRAIRGGDRGEARVRWSLPFVWELRREEWGTLLATITAATPEERPLSLEDLRHEPTEEALARILDGELARRMEALPETHAFGLAALAFAVTHDMDVFTVEDDIELYAFDEGREPPHFMDRLNADVLAAPEETRIEQARQHVEATLEALHELRAEDALASARTARWWSWGVRDAELVAHVYRTSATAWLEAEEIDRAITDASFSIHLSPEADAFDTRGIARHLSGDAHGAIEDYSSAVAIAPDLGRVLSNRAEALLDIGEFEAALADAERAMELEPEDTAPIVARGRAQLRMGRLEEARADAERADAMGDDSLLVEMGGASVG